MTKTSLALLSLLLVSCSDETPSPREVPPQQAKPVKATAPSEPAAEDHAALLAPEEWAETAPQSFRTRLETTKGDVLIEVRQDWAPEGARRFYNLVRSGYLDGCSFYRVLDNTVAEFGIHGSGEVNQAWSRARIPDDPVRQSNEAGMLSFAKTGAPHSRTTQVFINLESNTNLDRRGYAPFGRVISGIEVARSLYSGYGEHAPRGRGPDRTVLMKEGKTYLRRGFPELDSIVRASIVQ